ncbi:MAG TPA: iron-sulfur cluster assembly accessory protein [Chromatiales bacterium]|nr:iron-sulfur cluster assembly accessory protein [Chromatiales bacterium]
MSENTATAQDQAARFEQRLTEAELRLTEAAQEKLRGLLEEARRDDDAIQGVRIYVAGGGCGGMGYGMTFADEVRETDAVLELDGLRIVIDAVALAYMRGAEIDYVEERFGGSFVFNNVFQAVGGTGVCSACGAAGGGCA